VGCLLLVSLASSCSSGGGGSGATTIQNFTPLAATLGNPRFFHAQLRLGDGRVLISGGLSVANPLPLDTSSAEIFDPATGLFGNTNPMAMNRNQHRMVLLATGNVVVVGGNIGDTRVEIYNPASDTFTVHGQLSEARFGPTATLLPDGKIFVAGGLKVTITSSPPYYVGQPLMTFEVYDPVTGSAPPLTATLRVARAGHTATRLQSGKILIVGGNTSTGLPDLFDINTGFDLSVGSLNVPREDHRATLLPSGRVLITGGSDANGNSLRSAEIYDPPTKSFALLASLMSEPREDHTATLLANGKVLITGGEDNAAGPGGADIVLQSADLFDPSTNTFTSLPDLTVPRDDHRATLLNDGRVLLTGGEDSNGNGMSSAELFLP
jgi:hypothetical protein